MEHESTVTEDKVDNEQHTGENGEDEKKIRRSTREIKRPKFDDELVDTAQPLKKRTSSERSSSIASIGEAAPAQTPLESPTPQVSTAIPTSTVQSQPSISVGTAEAAMPVNTTAPGTNEQAQNEQSETPSSRHELRRRVNMVSVKDRIAMEEALQNEEAERLERKRREARIASKDIRAKELAAANEAAEALTAEDIRSWTAQDDLALITAVSHICDLNAVYRGIMFSRHYSLAEIEERWYQLMYDEALSRQCKKRMLELSPEEILRIQSVTVFSVEEENLLASVPTTPLPDLDTMGLLLCKSGEKFHSARTPQVLLDHWMRMREHGCLAGPSGRPQRPCPIELERIERSTVLTGENLLQTDLVRQYRNLQHVHELESKLQKVTVELVTGIVNDANIDSAVLATIRGRVVRFVIRAAKVVLGRSTFKNQVDIDLNLEGPALKVSRRQATVERDASGQFWLENIGQRPMHVDGKAIAQRQRTPLRDSSIIEVALIKLVFRLAQHQPR